MSFNISILVYMNMCVRLIYVYVWAGEKLVRGLFAIARERAPSIIFVDEIDSILSRRSSQEHEASRRLKTEFLIQLDGVQGQATQTAHVVVIGATNLPEGLDEAMLRRMPKRLYVGPPDQATREAMLRKLLHGQHHSLTAREFTHVARLLDGFSGSDIRAVCGEASMGPIRDVPPASLVRRAASSLAPIALKHFQQAVNAIHPSVSKEQLEGYRAWGDKQKAQRG